MKITMKNVGKIIGASLYILALSHCSGPGGIRGLLTAGEAATADTAAEAIAEDPRGAGVRAISGGVERELNPGAAGWRAALTRAARGTGNTGPTIRSAVEPDPVNEGPYSESALVPEGEARPEGEPNSGPALTPDQILDPPRRLEPVRPGIYPEYRRNARGARVVRGAYRTNFIDLTETAPGTYTPAPTSERALESSGSRHTQHPERLIGSENLKDPDEP